MSAIITTICLLLTTVTAFTSPSLHGIRSSLVGRGQVDTSLDLLLDQTQSWKQRISQPRRFPPPGFSDRARPSNESGVSHLLAQENDIIDEGVFIPSSIQVIVETNIAQPTQDDKNGGTVQIPSSKKINVETNIAPPPQDDKNPGTVLMATQSIFLLNLVAVIWGTQHSVIKMVVEDCDASAFSLARFGLAAIIASPFTPDLRPLVNIFSGWENKRLENTVDKSSVEEHEQHINDKESILAWRWGLEMGLWMFLGYAFQAIGLEYTTAQRSGFLLYLNVKFVPFFARIFLGRKISIPTWISALIAFTGTALLSYGDVGNELNAGDLWSVAAAAASAMFILRLETATRAVKASSSLNSASLWVVTLMALVWCICEGLYHELMLVPEQPNYDIFFSAVESTTSNVLQTISSHPVSLIYLGGVTTAFANYIQTIAQRGVTAERASIIYALDPVYGAFFANLLLGEQLSSIGYIGAALITFAAAGNAYLDLGRNNNDGGGTSTSSVGTDN